MVVIIRYLLALDFDELLQYEIFIMPKKMIFHNKKPIIPILRVIFTGFHISSGFISNTLRRRYIYYSAINIRLITFAYK